MGHVWHDNVEALAAYLDCYRKSTRFVAVSGGWDPLHVGHVRHLRAAAILGDSLLVIVNGDDFLLAKKGYAFMPLAERMEIVAALAGVCHVVSFWDGSMNVAGALSTIRPHVFAKGGDRSNPEEIDPAERQICRKIGCDIAYGVGGSTKPQSSSRLVEKACRAGV